MYLQRTIYRLSPHPRITVSSTRDAAFGGAVFLNHCLSLVLLRPTLLDPGSFTSGRYPQLTKTSRRYTVQVHSISARSMSCKFFVCSILHHNHCASLLYFHTLRTRISVRTLDSFVRSVSAIPFWSWLAAVSSGVQWSSAAHGVEHAPGLRATLQIASPMYVAYIRYPTRPCTSPPLQYTVHATAYASWFLK